MRSSALAFIYKYKTPLKYGLVLGISLILFQTIRNFYIMTEFSLETYVGIVALLFLIIGAFVGIKYADLKIAEKNNTAPQLPINYPHTSNIDRSTAILKYELTNREIEILDLIAQGKTYKEISDELFISLNTSKSHIKNIYQKLGVSNKTQAANLWNSV